LNKKKPRYGESKCDFVEVHVSRGFQGADGCKYFFSLDFAYKRV